MLKDTHEFQCVEKCARAFQELRQQVIATQIVTLSVENKDYTMLTNVSDEMVGMCFTARTWCGS